MAVLVLSEQFEIVQSMTMNLQELDAGKPVT